MKPVLSHLTKHVPTSMLLLKLGTKDARNMCALYKCTFFLNKKCMEMVCKTLRHVTSRCQVWVSPCWFSYNHICTKMVCRTCNISLPNIIRGHLANPLMDTLKNKNIAIPLIFYWRLLLRRISEFLLDLHSPTKEVAGHANQMVKVFLYSSYYQQPNGILSGCAKLPVNMCSFLRLLHHSPLQLPG